MYSNMDTLENDVGYCCATIMIDHVGYCPHHTNFGQPRKRVQSFVCRNLSVMLTFEIYTDSYIIFYAPTTHTHEPSSSQDPLHLPYTKAHTTLQNILPHIRSFSSPFEQPRSAVRESLYPPPSLLHWMRDPLRPYIEIWSPSAPRPSQFESLCCYSSSSKSWGSRNKTYNVVNESSYINESNEYAQSRFLSKKSLLQFACAQDRCPHHMLPLLTKTYLPRPMSSP